MAEDFKQTVDLKKRLERAKKPASSLPARQAGAKPEAKGEPAIKERLKKTPTLPKDKYAHSKKARRLDHVYDDEKKIDYKKISRPKTRETRVPIFKIVVVILGIILAGGILYGFVFRNKNDNKASVNKEPIWYAVKLTNNEVYYGQIKDVSADPIVISNVYYNYDQLTKNTDKKTETNNLRLVKRGKEAHGPAGTMDIVRDQVIYMEPLSADSKVLKAILDYEK